MKTTGQRIKEARLAAGLTQTELADKIGVKHPAIHKYESGAITNLKRDTIGALAAALNVKPSWLMCMDEEKPIPEDELSAVKTELIELVKSLSEEECQAVLRILKR